MRLNLLGWKCEGLRCPDFDFDLNQKGSALATFLQMPNGVHVATVALNASKNAGILAAQIIALTDKSISTKIDQYKSGLEKKVIDSSKTL